MLKIQIYVIIRLGGNMTYKKGLAPVVIVLIVALGLAAGTGVGYAFREPIKKAIKGETTQDEINKAVEAEKNGQSKFELKGIVTSVDVANSIVTVKIKSSTDSIKELRLSETPITVSKTATITNGDLKDQKIADIPIDSQVHVGGTIAEGKLTGTKIIVQKEDANENSQTRFAIGGIVKEVGSDKIVVTVSTANKSANSQKGKDLSISVASPTQIEKGDLTIALSGIKVGDEIQVTGTIQSSEYIASKIEVKVKEQAEVLKESSVNSNSNANKNK